MSEAKTNKIGRKAKTIEEEIEAQQEKLRKLQEKKRKQEQRERERNEKAVLALIKREGLNTIPVEIWEKALPQMKKLIQEAETKKAEVEQTEEAKEQPDVRTASGHF
jgi:hypothetical protein